MRILIWLTLAVLLAGCSANSVDDGTGGIAPAAPPPVDYTGRWVSTQQGDFEIFRTTTGYLAIFSRGPRLATTIDPSGMFTMRGSYTDSRSGITTDYSASGRILGGSSMTGTWTAARRGGISFGGVSSGFSAFKQRHETGSLR